MSCSYTFVSIALASSFSVVGNFFGRSHCIPVLTPQSLSTLLSTINCLSSAVFFGTAAFLALFNSSCVRGVAYLELGVVEELFKYYKIIIIFLFKYSNGS